MRATDARLQRLTEELTALGYGAIILADHSQHDAPAEGNPGHFHGTHDGSVEEDFLVPCTWVR